MGSLALGWVFQGRLGIGSLNKSTTPNTLQDDDFKYDSL